MPDLNLPDYKIMVLAAAALYLILALLLPVRKKKQPVLTWLIAIAAQLATVWYFDFIKDTVSGLIPQAAEAAGIELPDLPWLNDAATIALCVIANIILIILLNALASSFGKRRFKKQQARQPSQKDRDAEVLEQLQKEIAAAAISINSSDKQSRDRQAGKKNNKPGKDRI